MAGLTPRIPCQDPRVMPGVLHIAVEDAFFEYVLT